MISFIGDVHGHIDRYEQIVRFADYSIQVGDFGFHPAWDWLSQSDLDPARHKILRGNHDLPPSSWSSPHCLGDYGMVTLDGHRLFFLRGADSIDKAYRVEGTSWWADEELNGMQLTEAFLLYEKERPSIVVTHEAPAYLKMMLCGEAPDRTSQCLDQMWSVHKPQIWIHGHHHKSARYSLLGTNFVSLAELEVFRI